MAASANWQCRDCDNVNGPGDRSCDGCGTARPAPAPRSPAKRPAPARPAGDWKCSKCDTNNVTSDLSCIGCGTGWKAATKKPAPRRAPGAGGAATGAKAAGPGAKAAGPGTPAPKRPTPKRSAPSAPRTPRASAPPPPTAPTPPRARPEGVFYPPPGTGGYTPTAPGPSVPHPPPAAAPPPYVAPRASYAPSKKRSNGCVGCLSAIGLVFVLGVFADGCKSLFQDGATAKPSASASGSPCPSRVADALPSGEGAGLVEAFRTQNKQITLCRTTAGDLYYYGEFSDHREPGIAMAAKKTDSGYEATNSPYRYVIHDGVVTIYESGSRIGQEKVTPEPSPS